MRAAVLRAVGDLAVRDHPVPRPGSEEVLVAVHAAGVCHTDLHLVDAVPEAPPLPLVLGHEFAGEVVECGPGAPDSLLGRRVLVYYYNGCGECRWCGRGAENLCPDLRQKWGFTADGGFAEYVRVAARCCVVLPDSVSTADAAALGCSGTTALHAVNRVAAVRDGDVVVVLGVGGVGLSVVQAARSAGATVIAAGRSAANLRRARELGAAATVDTGRDGLDSAVRELTGGDGWDVAFDMVGSGGTPGAALRCARSGGTLVLVGYTGEPAAVDVARIVTNELVVRGAVGSTLDDAREVVRLAAQGRMTPTISQVHSLENAGTALRMLREDRCQGRAVLVPRHLA